MTEEIRKCCTEQGDRVPETLAEYAAVIYNSLAVCYRDAVAEIEAITGAQYDAIHIVGGGSSAEYLNERTAKETRRTVIAGPKEATAVGNLMVQAVGAKIIRNLAAAMPLIKSAFPVAEYQPADKEAWDAAYVRFEKVLQK